MNLLKISVSNFSIRNLHGNGENGNTAALAVLETSDQMHLSRTITSGAHRQLASEARFSASPKQPPLHTSWQSIGSGRTGELYP
jgi:hypothetical protein